MSVIFNQDVSIITQLLDLIDAIKAGAVEVSWVIGLLWIIQILNSAANNVLCVLGIIPRHPIGLFGILFAPFIHAGFNHLFFNSIPFFLLLTFMLTFGLDQTVCATLTIVVLGGLGVWLFGRKSIHVGASGLIMGYMGFIMYKGYYAANISSLIVGVVSFYYLGSILFSLIPTGGRSSWEGHLFGFLAGIFAAHYGCMPPFDTLSSYLMSL